MKCTTTVYFEIEPHQLPIIYRSEYNVRFCGLEKLHPFDAAKWSHIFHYLKEAMFINDHSVTKPNEVQQEDLLVVHTPEYLKSLKWSWNVARIAEIPPLSLVPNFIVQKCYLKPMRYQTGGSILAGKLALDRGWAINIGGGFHHCSKDRGGGFCPYADITLLLKFLFLHGNNVKKAMIVDLDAHQVELEDEISILDDTDKPSEETESADTALVQDSIPVQKCTENEKDQPFLKPTSRKRSKLASPGLCRSDLSDQKEAMSILRESRGAFLAKQNVRDEFSIFGEYAASEGNGYERDFLDHHDVYILDVYNKGIYPKDELAKKAIKRHIELYHFTEDDEYLTKVEINLEKALREFHPDVVVYNAGTDVLDGDRLGLLAITPQGIIRRDELVFLKVRKHKIPIVMLTSGGYQKKTARIIADSILNLNEKGLIPALEISISN